MILLAAALPGLAHAQSSLRIEPEPVVRIGLLDGPPGYLFQFIVGGAFLPGDRLAVADRGTHSVRIFDAAGRLVSESGGEGGGPAEFQYIDQLWTRADTVLVHDPMASKIVRFDTDGEFIRSEPFPVGMARYLGAGAGGGIWLSRLARQVESSTRGLRRDAHAVELHRGGDVVAEISGLTGLWRLDRSPYAFSPTFQAVVAGNSLVVPDPVAGLLRVYGPTGALTRQIRVPAPRVDFGEAKRAVERELTTREVRNAPSDLSERLRDLPEMELPRLSHMLLDDRHRVWIKQYDPAEDAHWLGGWAGPEGGTWWVVDLASGRSTEVAVPAGVHPLAIAGDRLLGRHTDEYGVQRAVVHRITSSR